MGGKELLNDEQALEVGLRCTRTFNNEFWNSREINVMIYLLNSIRSKNFYILKTLNEEKYKPLKQLCGLILYILDDKTQQIKQQPTDFELGLIIYLATDYNIINPKIESLINPANFEIALHCAGGIGNISAIDKLIHSNFISVDKIDLNYVLEELLVYNDVTKQTIGYILQKSEEFEKNILALHPRNSDDRTKIAYWAGHQKNVEIIEFLIEKGFNVNAALNGFIVDTLYRHSDEEKFDLNLITLDDNESKIFSLLIDKGASLEELFDERWHHPEDYDGIPVTKENVLIFFNSVINQQMLKLIIATNSFIIEPKEEQTKLNEFKIKKLKIFIEERMADLTLEKKVKCLYRSIQISENLGTSMIFNKLRSEPDICISGDIKKKITEIITGTGTETDKEKLKYDSELYHGLVLPLRRKIQHGRKSTSQLPPRLKLDDTQGHSKSDKQEPPKQRPRMV